MRRKLSNTAERFVIERGLGRDFRFPKLYQSHTVINGSEETLLPVITIDRPDIIDFAIWGMLPSDYKDEWADFQNILETLTVPKEEILTSSFYKQPLLERRCLVVITGFFSYHLHEGVLYPYHIYVKKNSPFCVAGIYNILEDGFITCSIITRKVTDHLKDIQNVNGTMPLIVPRLSQNTWLNPELKKESIIDILDQNEEHVLKADPIAKELFNQNISFDSMLAPVHYNNVPGRHKG